MKINDSKHFRILGTNLQQNMNWSEHLSTGPKAILPAIRRKLGALKLMGKQLPRDTRKLLADGLITSKFIYMITQWGGASQNLITAAQRLQNQVARWINNSGKRTRIAKLLLECNWLSLDELTSYHSLIQLWKICRLNKPENFLEFEPDNHNKIFIEEPRLQFTSHGYKWRTIALWNTLPENVTDIRSLPTFKKRIRAWIISLRPLEPD